MLQNMYFGLEIFILSHLYFCVIDFRKVESTLFHYSSISIGVECIEKKMGLPEWPQDKTTAEEPVDMQHKSDSSCKYSVKV